MRRIVCGFFISLFCLSPALADDDLEGWGDEGDDAGFAETPDIKVDAPATPSALAIDGFLRSRSGIWLERLAHQPISSLRQSLDLKATYKADSWRLVLAGHGEYDPAYTAVNQDQYGQQVQDSYGLRFLHGDQYLALSIADTEWVLGRQTVAWGEGDFFSLLDATNPRDLREPGLSDLDDVRLPVLATRVTYFADWGRLEVFVTHETNQGERPPPLSEYSPFRSILGQDPALGALLETRTLEYADSPSQYHQGFSSIFMRAMSTVQSVDLGLYAAWVRDPQGVLAPPEGFELLGNVLMSGLDPTALDGLIPGTIPLDFEYPRYVLLGQTGSWASGPWVFKYELVGEIHRTWNTADLSETLPILGQKTGTRVSLLGSASYTAGDDTMISGELRKGMLIDPPANVLFPTDAPQLGLRYSRQYLRQTLRLDVAGSVMGLQAEYGWLARSEITYDVMDAVKAGLMLIHYHPGDDGELSVFSGMGTHDQLFLKLRWDFQVY